jgi:hypothetical protein
VLGGDRLRLRAGSPRSGGDQPRMEIHLYAGIQELPAATPT